MQAVPGGVGPVPADSGEPAEKERPARGVQATPVTVWYHSADRFPAASNQSPSAVPRSAPTSGS